MTCSCVGGGGRGTQDERRERKRETFSVFQFLGL